MMFSLMLMMASVLDIDRNATQPVHESDIIGGVCYNAAGSQIDTSGVELVINKIVRISATTSAPLYAQIDRDVVRVAPTKDISGPFLVFNVPAEVNSADLPDIKLYHARIDGRHFIYWTETFVNRENRHGLFLIVGDRMKEYCRGTRGFTVLR